MCPILCILCVTRYIFGYVRVTIHKIRVYMAIFDARRVYNIPYPLLNYYTLYILTTHV